MPSPAGWKEFSAGAVLTASVDVQQHLMDQAVCVFADSSARSTAISSPAEGQVSYLKDTNSVEVYDGSAWVAVGGGVEWSGSTADGLATYGSSSTVVSESTATYDGTTLTLTGSGGGLKMDGLASSDANTLDDYEEGTWTPTLDCGSGTATVASGENTMAYIKIGRCVHICGSFSLSAISSPSGTLYIAGLPFTSANLTESADQAAFALTWGGVSSNTNPVPFGYINLSSGTRIRVQAGNGQPDDSTPADHLSASSWFQLGGWYYANS